MSTRKKADSTLLKEAQARIEELEQKVKSKESTLEMYHNQANERSKEIDAVHSALDSVGVPREVVTTDSYCGKQTMSLTARLFAWSMGARISKEGA